MDILNRKHTTKIAILNTLTLPLMIIKNMFMFGVDVYIFNGLIYGIARLLFGEQATIVILGNILLQWLLLLGVILFFILLGLRSWGRASVLSLFTLAFVLVYGNLFLPNSQTIEASKITSLRVMTYNLAVELTQPNELLEIINEQQPDIAALVELSDTNGRMLQDRLSEEYPYQVYSVSDVQGKALLSKYPIITHELFTLKTLRKNIRAQILIDEQQITVFVVHPPSPNFYSKANFYLPDENHLPEIEGLLDHISTDSPTLLLGDFNMTDQSIPYQMVKQAGFTDTFREVGFGFGATFRLDAILLPHHYYVRLWQDPALARIDFIWHSAAFRSSNAWVLPNTISDHSPLLADLHLTQNTDF